MTYGDIPLLIKVVLSTASRERVMIFDLLLNSKGAMTTSQVSKSLNISTNTALRTMAELKALQLVSGDPIDMEYMEGYSDEAWIRNNNEQHKITLHRDFDWFLTEEFKRLRGEFVPDGKSKYDKDEDSVKKISPHTEQRKTD